MKKALLLVVGVLIVGLLMAPALALGEPKYGGTLVYGTESDLKQLDPQKSETAVEGAMFYAIVEPLLAPDKDLIPQPHLAESWEVSEDGTEWTIYLKKGIKFHNGREMTAEDVKWTFDRIMDPKTASSLKILLTEVDSFQVVDRYTVKFILKAPSGGFISSLYHPYVFTFQVMAHESVNEDGSITHPIGTGPFEFVEWKPNDYIRLKKFKDYWMEGLPYLDELILKPVPDETIRLTSLKTGDLDIARFLPLDEVAKYKENPQPGYVLEICPGGAIWDIGFNVSKPPFDDKRVRQAFAYGIEKNEIELGISFGVGQVVNQPFLKESFWYCDVPDYERDVEKAKALLKEAGYPDGLDITLTTANSYPQMLNQAAIMQAQLKEAGFNVELDVSDWVTLVSKYRTGEYTVQSGGWVATVDPSTVYPWIFVPGATFNNLIGDAYDNPEVTRLINKGGQTIDPDERKAIYTEMLKILLDDCPMIFTVYTGVGMGWQSRVKDYDSTMTVLVYSGGGLQYTWLDK